MAEIQIVLTTDSSFFSRLARLLGAEYTHAMLRFAHPVEGCWPRQWVEKYGGKDTFMAYTYHIIEAGFRHGVIERAWNPEEYSKWAAYRVKPPNPDYEAILDYARGNIGKFYAFDKLMLVLPRFIRHIAKNRFDMDDVFYDAKCTKTFWGGQRAHICSSLVDDAFYYGDADLVSDIDTPWVLPDDIRDSPLLELLPPEGTIEWERSEK